MDQLVILDRQCAQVEQLGRKEFLPSMVYGAFRDDDNLYGFANDLDRAGADYRSRLRPREEIGLPARSRHRHGRESFAFRIALTFGIATPRVANAREAAPTGRGLCSRSENRRRQASHSGRKYPGNNSQIPKILRHEDIVVRVTPTYKGRSFDPNGFNSNAAEIDKEADYYLDIEETYQTLRPADGTYAGIVPYSPDGVLHHIVWSWGNGGPTTTRDSHTTRTTQLHHAL